jgi:glucose/arabinose dehydrogenase
MTDREMLEVAMEEARSGLGEGGIPIGAALAAERGADRRASAFVTRWRADRRGGHVASASIRRVLRGLVLLFAAWVAVGCGPGESRDGADGGATRTLATGLQVPWGIAFLPGGNALVSERTTGRIWRISRDGSPKRTVMRVPGVDTDSGEGGLLGLALSPSYASDGLVYAYVTSDTDNRIVRFRLGGGLHPILTGIRRGDIHDGGRIAFGPDGKLYASVGEAGDGELAQDPASLNGKILRMNADGSVPRDNPFADSLVWTLGHRNVEGFAWDSSGRLWATEFGQDEFDELNLIRSGRNYGWPEVEGRGPTDGGRFTNPLVTWSTSEASPSGAAIRSGELYIGALQGQAVLRVRLNGQRAQKLNPLLQEAYGRIRTVERAPDGSLWVTTSNRDGRGSPKPGDDRILRLP